MRIFTGVIAMMSLFFTHQAFAVCTPPVVYASCCDYKFTDGQTSKDVNYRGPKAVFDSASKAQTWAKGVVAQMPFNFPYEPNQVTVLQGWLSNGGNSHSAVDSWRAVVSANTDASFEVRAAAPGRVVAKLWDNWNGNVLVIEHTAPNGAKYRSLYFHLRNGYTHDRNAALAIVASDPKGNDNVAKYVRFAKNFNSKLYWGEESHAIPVNVGDSVKARQLIAYSGNTGAGGAGSGLNNDGSPTNTVRANNHLHFMLSVPSPKKSDEWVFVDPYGVYGKANTGCYAVLKEIEYARFYAPFHPNFHNINWELYKFYANYYPNMGWGPQTLSVYKAGNTVKAAGAFHPNVEAPSIAQGYLSEAEFEKALKANEKEGLRPRELHVTAAPDGSPRFTVIWQKKGKIEYVTLFNLNNAEFTKKWNDLVDGKDFRAEEHIAYSVKGESRHTAVLAKDGQTTQLWFDMTPDEYAQKVQYLSANGWRNISFNAAEMPEGIRYGGVWMQKTGSWASWFNMNPANYQQKFDQYTTQGLRLWRIQGYNDGKSFGAIWTN